MPGAATPTRESRPALLRALPLLVIAAAVLVVWHRALDLFFSQDDFVCLARARELAPRLTGPWRFLSAQAVFDLLNPMAGVSPRPYHAASLAIHLACSLILYLRLARLVRAPAALVGSVFFAVHPALFTAIYWIAAITDPMACAFTLLTVIAWRRTHPVRWLAVALRVLFPQVAEVRFAHRHEPLDSTWRWVLARPTGEARVLAPAMLDSLIRIHGPPR